MVADRFADPMNFVILGWVASFIVAVVYALRSHARALRVLEGRIRDGVNGQVRFAAKWRVTRARHNVWMAGSGLVAGIAAAAQVAFDTSPSFRPYIVAALMVLAAAFVRGLVIDERRLDALEAMLSPVAGAPRRRRGD